MSVEELRRPANPSVLQFHANHLVRGLKLIPPISTEGQGYANRFELELFDEPRTRLLTRLAGIASQLAEQQVDPSPIIDASRPFVSRLFSVSDQVGVMLSWLEASARYGSALQPLVDSTVQIIEGVTDKAYSAEQYARLGETLARVGQTPQAQAMFALADTRLTKAFDAAKEPYQIVSLIDPIEDVVRLKLKAGDPQSARKTIDLVPWDDIKKVFQDELTPEIEEAERGLNPQ